MANVLTAHDKSMSDKATDRELADLLAYHIEHPCVEPRTGANIKPFYIREAKRIIGTFTDPAAKKTLEESINKYSSQ